MWFCQETALIKRPHFKLDHITLLTISFISMPSTILNKRFITIYGFRTIVSLMNVQLSLTWWRVVPFEQALVMMDRGYESYNVMAHCQEKNWSYIIRIRDGNHSMKSRFNLPETPCFDKEFDLNICRKQTNEMKQQYQNFPNHYRCLPNHTPFDFLPQSSRKCEPINF